MKTNAVSFTGKENLLLLLSNPILLQRLEGLVLLVGGVWAWFALGGSWLWLVLLILWPDLSMLGYRAGPKVGAALYNLVHSYPLAALLLAWGLLSHNPLLVLAAVLLLSHIGMDRALGYGLKRDSAFGDTHLGYLGRKR